MQNLYETIGSEAYNLGLTKPQIPTYIIDNLKYPLFEWQKSALENLLTFQAIKEKKGEINNPTHLMFNMATGSGKTLLMAAAILYYYKEHNIRHFIFFVNRNNIIDKTENNFIDSTHNKYLFKEKITINNNIINIKQVESFSEEPQAIEIKFTSIQKLYNDIHLEKENCTTLDDLHRKNIVLLADEAHHLNTITKQQDEIMYITTLKDSTSKEEIERKGWEHTVIELILKKQNKAKNNQNILLEFTATIPEEKSIIKKYQDKIIYRFLLKEFLKKGYTKEVNLISSTLEKKERVLHALVFQWYRHEIALKNQLANFKPVILFRSKTIKESEEDCEKFLDWVERIQESDFDFLKKAITNIPKSQSIHEQGNERTAQIVEFIEKNSNYSKIVNFIKNHFSNRNIIITNSKTNKTQIEKTNPEQEKLLNSLENKNNHIRAIFTVDRLTEGWDVLNLFDIVRLYQGQNAGGSNKKTPKTTIKEMQLIGRGVRYFPFSHPEKKANIRKFDNDLTNELRILEELYYYTYDEESHYISHLKKELEKEGYISDNKKSIDFKLKENFKNTDFYKKKIIWQNKKIKNPNRRKKNLDDFEENFSFSYNIPRLKIKEQKLSLEKKHTENITTTQEYSSTIDTNSENIEKHIFQKAVHIKSIEKPLLHFENLKKELHIDSMDELQKQLAPLKMEIIAPSKKYEEFADIENAIKLKITLKFLDKVVAELKENIFPNIGTKEFYPKSFASIFGKKKTKSIPVNKTQDTLFENTLEKAEWYILDNFIGTSEEEALVKWIENHIGNLKEKYEEVYLLRNEEVYKIYDFKTGRGFQPDFLLFLQSKNKTQELCYQFLIEPKGNLFKDKDNSFTSSNEGWKEVFLEQINKESELDVKDIIQIETTKYNLIGLPLYNKENENKFTAAFQEKLLPDEAKN